MLGEIGDGVRSAVARCWSTLNQLRAYWLFRWRPWPPRLLLHLSGLGGTELLCSTLKSYVSCYSKLWRDEQPRTLIPSLSVNCLLLSKQAVVALPLPHAARPLRSNTRTLSFCGHPAPRESFQLLRSAAGS